MNTNFACPQCKSDNLSLHYFEDRLRKVYAITMTCDNCGHAAKFHIDLDEFRGLNVSALKAAIKDFAIAEWNEYVKSKPPMQKVAPPKPPEPEKRWQDKFNSQEPLSKENMQSKAATSSKTIAEVAKPVQRVQLTTPAWFKPWKGR